MKIDKINGTAQFTGYFPNEFHVTGKVVRKRTSPNYRSGGMYLRMTGEYITRDDESGATVIPQIINVGGSENIRVLHGMLTEMINYMDAADVEQEFEKP